MKWAFIFYDALKAPSAKLWFFNFILSSFQANARFNMHIIPNPKISRWKFQFSGAITLLSARNCLSFNMILPFVCYMMPRIAQLLNVSDLISAF